MTQKVKTGKVKVKTTKNESENKKEKWSFVELRLCCTIFPNERPGQGNCCNMFSSRQLSIFLGGELSFPSPPFF